MRFRGTLVDEPVMVFIRRALTFFRFDIDATTAREYSWNQ